MSIFLIIALLSGIVQLAGYIIYAKYSIFLDTIKPNAASWSIWAFGALLESYSYIMLTEDILKNILPFVCALCAILLFVGTLVKGKFGKVTRFEKMIVAVDIAIMAVWWYTSSPLLANILLIVTAIVSFIPMMVNVYNNPRNEHAVPWVVWTLAYLLQFTVVVGRYEKIEDILYPSIFFILHFIIAVLAFDIRRFSRNYQQISHSTGEHL